MEGSERKKAALIRILQILERESDSEHPLTTSAIIKKLENDYGIILERKAVGRSIDVLNHADYDITTTPRGSFIAGRDFTDSELRLLIDGVLSSRHITANYSKQLIEKIMKLSNKYFSSHIKNVYPVAVNDWSKSENAELFLNIEIVDKAIELGKRITFDYNRYDKHKKLRLAKRHEVSPYQMILHNQRYFLMARNEYWGDVTYYRMDKITNVELSDSVATPLRDNDGYKNGIDYKKFSSSLPYMFSDDIERIIFKIDGEWMIDQIVDWFGFDFECTDKNGELYITVHASPCAMEYWAMQYLNYVEIVSPKSLREKISENIKAASKKY